VRTAFAALALALALSCHSNASPGRAGAPPSAQAGLARSRVGLITQDGGRHAVQVELAATSEERRVGLMFREHLGEDEGMFFVFDEEAPLSFWMHNTLIPLDMVFIRSDGTVAGVVANATPRTDTPRGVGKPAQYVLEVNGGWCGAHGVRAGDRVEFSEALAAAHAKGGAGGER
jgi:uncharacterized membrane protein (UPF0127 family)